MIFKCEIELNNSEMQSGSDLYRALIMVAINYDMVETIAPHHSTKVRDINGNVVGVYKIIEE